MSNDDPLGMENFEEEVSRAAQRETLRDEIRNRVKIAIEAIDASELECKKQGKASELLYELASSKLSLLKVITEIDKESNHLTEKPLVQAAKVRESYT